MPPAVVRTRKPPSTKSPNWVPGSAVASVASSNAPTAPDTTSANPVVSTPPVATTTETPVAVHVASSTTSKEASNVVSQSCATSTATLSQLKLLSPQRPPPPKPTAQSEEKRSKRVRDDVNEEKDKPSGSTPKREIFVAKRKLGSPATPTVSDSPGTKAQPPPSEAKGIRLGHKGTGEKSPSPASPKTDTVESKAAAKPRGIRLGHKSQVEVPEAVAPVAVPEVPIAVPREAPAVASTAIEENAPPLPTSAPPILDTAAARAVDSLTDSPVLVELSDAMPPQLPSPIQKSSPTVASSNKESVSNFLKPTARSANRRNAVLGMKRDVEVAPTVEVPVPQTHSFFEDPESVKTHNFTPKNGSPRQSDLVDQRSERQIEETELAKEGSAVVREFDRRGAIFAGDIREYGQHLQVQSPTQSQAGLATVPEDAPTEDGVVEPGELVIHARSGSSPEKPGAKSRKDRELSSFFDNLDQVKKSSHTPEQGIHREATAQDNRTEEQRSASLKAVNAAADLPKREKMRRGALFGGDLRKPVVERKPSPPVVAEEPKEAPALKAPEAKPEPALSELGSHVLRNKSPVCLGCGRVFASAEARTTHQTTSGHQQRIP